MATNIEVEKPKEVYEEISRVVGVHYNKGSYLDTKVPFGEAYPELYRLYLAIAGAGLHK